MKESQKIRPTLRLKNRGGAPKANQNAWKNGLHTGECRARRAKVHEIVRHARRAIADAYAAAARDIRAMREI
jgi:hypothetical protein